MVMVCSSFGRDGRIKLIGGDNIEGLFVSPNQFPYKYLEVCTLIFTSEFIDF